MKFSSIKEFFYKLQSMCYAMLLLPLGILIVLYLVPGLLYSSFTIEDEQTVVLLLIIFPAVALLELTIVHLFLSARLDAISKLSGFGDRLDRYVPIAFIRTAAGVFLSIAMLVGLWLTGDSWFTGYAIAILAFIFLQRPTPENLCRQLKLKGNERELILRGELIN
jgi:hypothetical protein